MLRHGPASYKASAPDQVVDHLRSAGYTFAEPRSAAEHARMLCGKSLIVVYHNGTVLLQGADTETPRTILDSFQPSDVQTELPF